MLGTAGTQYAGEMKKGVFTAMNYLMPKRNVLSLHSGANVGAAGDVSLFFGLSGEGAGSSNVPRCSGAMYLDQPCVAPCCAVVAVLAPFWMANPPLA